MPILDGIKASTIYIGRGYNQDLEGMHYDDLALDDMDFSSINKILEIIKNNLQTVASLLRIQGRRCNSKEAKITLQDSVNSILAIAATHELLSKDIRAEVKIMKVINAIADNGKRCFSNVHKKNISA